MSIRQALSLTLLIVAVAPAAAEPPKLLSRMFAGAAKPIESDTVGQRMLAVEDGPWMILAHTFVGPNSQSKADRLASELAELTSRRTFIYKEKFDFTNGPKGAASETRRVRYVNPHEYEAYAVLVGEYDDVDHPNAERDLKQVKSVQPTIFGDQQVMAEETNKLNPVTAIKAMHHKWISTKKDQSGPMSSAFLTRNPMLPPEYFNAPNVDKFVEDMNDGLPHNLLDCKAKYTVTVRTFEGYGLIANGKFEKNFQPNRDRLDKCAADAAKMVAALRRKGVEAYQFHDRDKSIVTVGSFNTLGRELPDGQFEYAGDILKTIDQYRAFNVRPELASQVRGRRGEAAANHIENIPFDVQPVPIAVPTRSKRSLYSRAFKR